MTVPTAEQTNIAAGSCHGHGPADTHAAADRHGDNGGSARTATSRLLALPSNAKIIGAAVIGIGALLAVGVPLITLYPLLMLGGCLGMHLFMGHGMNHGGAHESHQPNEVATAGPTENASSRSDG
jgi:hypothetical protein